MKFRIRTLLSPLVVVLAAGFAQATAAASPHVGVDPTIRQMEACFREHGKLMPKPAVTNIYDCWRAHGYLMR